MGGQQALPVLLDGLARLEYRGYDSAGVAVLHDGNTVVRKSVGRLMALEDRLEKEPVHGTCGIGHTRWATHGEPSELNAHPHLDPTGRIAVVHNGIIENYQELKRELIAAGYSFRSETDTETIPLLIRYLMERENLPLLDAVRRALQRARGAYAVGIVSADAPDQIIAARLGSPLIVGIGDGENFIASDVPAILNRMNRVIYLDNGELAVLTREGVTVSKLDGTPVALDIQKVTLNAEAAEKAGFETFMLKEIHEQPRVLRNLLNRHAPDGHVRLDLPGMDAAFFRQLERIMIVSCGTACHAGIYGKLLIERFTGIAVEVDLASEFRYRDAKLNPETLVLSVSQSGETADTLASVRMARGRGCQSLTICNVPGSSLVRESDAALFTGAGPEIGVASTKAYTAQQMMFALLAIAIARARDEISGDEEVALIQALRAIPDAIHYVIDRKDTIKEVAEKHHDGPSSLYLGRKFNYPTALEGALKNKEISYQHAEGYAAGEMKHGPIALISEYLPVVCICTKTHDEVYEKMISNISEVKARRGRIIAVATDGDDAIASLAEDILYVPAIQDEFSPIVNIVALQLLAYYAAQARGADIDKPRNLAKSVTVE